MAPLQHNIPRIIAIGQLFILLQEAEALVLQHGQDGGVVPEPAVKAAYQHAFVVLAASSGVLDGLDGAEQLLADLSSVSDPARPVAVNVVMIGDNTDATAFTDIAARTGGTATTVPTSDSPDFFDLLGKLLY